MKNIITLLALFFACTATHAQNVETKLIPDQLTMVSFYADVKNQIFDYNRTFRMDTVISISITTEAYYNSLKDRQISHIIKDTAKYRRENGVLRLPVANTHIELKDEHSGEGDVINRNFYQGQIPLLNSYLVGFSGYEHYDYFLINKTTGERDENNFGDYPFISPNKKYLVWIFPFCYEPLGAEMGIYEIVDGKLEPLYSFFFVNWMPTAQKTEILWIDDNSLVVKVLPPHIYWGDDGYYNENGEYIKIEFLREANISETVK
jgi:hypothetical protein